MEFYFEIDFFYKLTDQRLSEEVVDDFFKRFLSRLTNTKIYFIRKDNNEPDFTTPNVFIQRLLNYQNVLPEFILYSNLNEKISNDESTGFKFLFLSEEFVCETISNDYGYLTLNPGNFNEVWTIIDSTRDDKKRFFSKEDTKNAFSSWRQLNNYKLPLNSLIIADRYLFSSEDEVEYNLVQILKNIGIKRLGKRRVDILIIGNEFYDYYKKRKSNRFYTGNEEFKKAYNKVKEILNEIFGSEEYYNFTLLRTDEKTIPSEKEIHFRILVSNNIFINPGTSFTIFNNKGPRAGEYITIDNFLNNETRNVNLEPLKLMKKALIKIADEPDVKKFHVHNNRNCKILN